MSPWEEIESDRLATGEANFIHITIANHALQFSRVVAQLNINGRQQRWRIREASQYGRIVVRRASLLSHASLELFHQPICTITCHHQLAHTCYFASFHVTLLTSSLFALCSAMESLGYKQKNKMVYQMIENMKQKSIDFDQFLDMMTARIVRKPLARQYQHMNAAGNRQIWLIITWPYASCATLEPYLICHRFFFVYLFFLSVWWWQQGWYLEGVPFVRWWWLWRNHFEWSSPCRTWVGWDYDASRIEGNDRPSGSRRRWCHLTRGVHQHHDKAKVRNKAKQFGGSMHFYTFLVCHFASIHYSAPDAHLLLSFQLVFFFSFFFLAASIKFSFSPWATPWTTPPIFFFRFACFPSPLAASSRICSRILYPYCHVQLITHDMEISHRPIHSKPSQPITDELGWLCTY